MLVVGVIEISTSSIQKKESFHTYATMLCWTWQAGFQCLTFGKRMDLPARKRCHFSWTSGLLWTGWEI
jgi:hypothetical protein